MKEFNLRELTKRGCTRREEKDFRDDGTKFKVVYYNDLEITYTKYENEYFLSIHINYYDRHLQYEDVPKELFKLADEYNGCYEVDPDKVIENAKIISEEMKKVEEKVNKELEVKPDTRPLIERSLKEIMIGTRALEEFKNSETIYKMTSEWEIKDALEDLHSLEDNVKYLKEMNWDDLENYEIRNKLASLKSSKYIKIEGIEDFYIKELNNYIKKYK